MAFLRRTEHIISFKSPFFFFIFWGIFFLLEKQKKKQKQNQKTRTRKEGT
jgi:preprotein translocase subunit YajC